MATGEKELLSPFAASLEAYFEAPQFSRDGMGVYVITDQNSEFHRLIYMDLRTRSVSVLSQDIKWDVDDFNVPDGNSLAFTVNEDGISRLYVLDVKSGQRKSIDKLPIGVISGLKWHLNSMEVAFNVRSTRSPSDIYSLDVKTGNVETWSTSSLGDLDTSAFALPEAIRWQSFDGRNITGFVYRPTARFNGKRPVIIDIHGGPEDQYRPQYGYEDNYFINELGVVKIYPNVRGSSGYGKTFLNLDNGRRREDAVKDVGALLDWIATQPDLDAQRVMVQGASYGGDMALAVSTKYSGRIRAVVSDCAPSNLATFIENTEGWRRDIRRAEFGDERYRRSGLLWTSRPQ